MTVHVETSFLFVSDKPATISHLLLDPESSVVKPANSWCARRQSRHVGTSRVVVANKADCLDIRTLEE